MRAWYNLRSSQTFTLKKAHTCMNNAVCCLELHSARGSLIMQCKQVVTPWPLSPIEQRLDRLLGMRVGYHQHIQQLVKGMMYSAMNIRATLHQATHMDK